MTPAAAKRLRLFGMIRKESLQILRDPSRSWIDGSIVREKHIFIAYLPCLLNNIHRHQSYTK